MGHYDIKWCEMVKNMRMFLGEYNPNITEGSRIALPKRLREQISGDEIILSKGFDKCVFAYDKEDWEQRTQKQIENFSSERIRRSDLERYLYTSAAEVPVDAQGRIVMPADLIKYAGVSSKTAVVGVGDHIEIWDYDTWKDRLKVISAQLGG